MFDPISMLRNDSAALHDFVLVAIPTEVLAQPDFFALIFSANTFMKFKVRNLAAVS